MKLELKSKTICGVLRHILLCPHCKKKILLDDKLFYSDPREVECAYCNNKFTVVKFVRMVDHIELEILDGTEDNGKGKN